MMDDDPAGGGGPFGLQQQQQQQHQQPATFFNNLCNCRGQCRDADYDAAMQMTGDNADNDDADNGAM